MYSTCTLHNLYNIIDAIECNRLRRRFMKLSVIWKYRLYVFGLANCVTTRFFHKFDALLRFNTYNTHFSAFHCEHAKCSNTIDQYTVSSLAALRATKKRYDTRRWPREHGHGDDCNSRRSKRFTNANARNNRKTKPTKHTKTKSRTKRLAFPWWGSVLI